MKKIEKKSTYQPPKLTSKTKWMPPKEENKSNNDSEESPIKKTDMK